MSASATISGPASRELVRGFLSGGGELGALMRAFPGKPRRSDRRSCGRKA